MADWREKNYSELAAKKLVDADDLIKPIKSLSFYKPLETAVKSEVIALIIRRDVLLRQKRNKLRARLAMRFGREFGNNITYLSKFMATGEDLDGDLETLIKRDEILRADIWRLELLMEPIDFQRLCVAAG